MVWRIGFAADADRDFGLISDHLVSADRVFGDADDAAFDRAIRRVTIDPDAVWPDVDRRNNQR